MPSTLAPDLPFIDEHSVEVDAPAERVWETVRDRMHSPASRLPRAFAAAIGVKDTEPVLGFHVARQRRGSDLVLEGAHRFSRYRLGFHIDPLGTEHSRLRARTDAVFPGPHGRVYKAFVIDSRAHVVLVRRMLGQLKRAAERT